MKIAKEKAKAELDKLFYSALEWPTNRDGYLKYRTQFSRWIPRQSTNPAWTDPGTDEQQEVYDRLCHFYFLVDQQLPDGRIVENDEWFSNWLGRIRRFVGLLPQHHRFLPALQPSSKNRFGAILPVCGICKATPSSTKEVRSTNASIGIRDGS